MAQKKRKEPEVKEDYTFTPPDFDEKGFLEKDIVVTKSVIITAAIAVIFGLVAYLTTDITFALGVLLIFIGALSLKKVFDILPWDFSQVENKTWLGNGVMFILLALGIWILLLNPPFSDTIDPQIDDMQVWSGDVMLTRPYNNVPVEQMITFNATVTDNGDLDSVTFSFLGSGNQTWDMTSIGDDRYEFTHIFVSAGTYNFVLAATDAEGNQQTFSGSVTVV